MRKQHAGLFKKGNSGNPYGSRGKALSLLSNELIMDLGKKGKEGWGEIVDRIILMMKEGNIPALRFFGDHVLGKPTETIFITQDSDIDRFPLIATKEGRDKASKIIEQAMKDIEKLNENSEDERCALLT